MKITLTQLIKQYHNKLNYLGTRYDHKHKQYIEIENDDFAKCLVAHYDNLRLFRTTAQFAPEIHSYFITLK